MRQLLEALRTWPEVELEPLRAGPEWERARTWGWVMESGELTGTGWAHIRELPRGILIDRRSEMGDPHVHAHSAPIPRELAESGRNP